MKIAAAALLFLPCLTSAAFAAEPDWKAAFDSTERLTKGQKGGYFYKRGTLGEHIFEGMGIPRNGREPVALTDGNYMFSGCRRHSCFQKSAIVVAPSGEMLAAALMHYPGCQDNDPKTACTVGSELVAPLVTIVLRRSHKDETLAKHLRQWAWREEPKVNTFEVRFLEN